MTGRRPLVLFVMIATLAAGAALGQNGGRTDADGAPPGPGILADMIREGDIELGGEKSLALGDRFHRIHTRYMSLQCGACHANVEFPQNIQFLRREDFPLAAYPGAVDRAICMGCHRGEHALATPFYAVPKP